MLTNKVNIVTVRHDIYIYIYQYQDISISGVFMKKINMSRLMVFGIGLLFLAMYTNNSFAYTITIDDNFDKFCHFRDGRIDYNILGKCTRWRSNIRTEDVPNE